MRRGSNGAATQLQGTQSELSESDWIGDFLVTFGRDRRTSDRLIPTRGSGSQHVWKQGRGVILQRPAGDWRGFPVHRQSVHDWTIWTLGELYGDSSHRAVRDVVNGVASPAGLNGHFLIFATNGSEWHVWTDRFGTIHCYYGSKNGISALGTFSPSVGAYIDAQRLDWKAITGFCATSMFLEDRTYYSEVSVLRPATHYVFSDDGEQRKKSVYHTWSFRPDHTRSYDDTVDEFGERLTAVMEDHVEEGRIALPISGGLDSRSTVAAMPVSDSRIWAFSYGYTDRSPETRIAKRIAHLRHLNFEQFRTRPYLFRELDDVIDSVEGFQDLTQSRQASITTILGRKADYVIAAHWGDVWLDSVRANHESGSLVDRIQKKIQKRGRSWLLANVCGPQISSERPDDVVRNTIESELYDIPDQPDDSYRFKAFKTNQWSFRWTLASLRQYQRAAFPRLPFYDIRLTDFLTTVPSDYLSDRRLQIDYLKRFARDLASVKWQRYDADLFSYHRYNTWHVPKRAFKKLKRMTFRKREIRRNWEVQFLSEQGRAGLRRWLLEPGLRLHDFVDRGDVESLLDDFYHAPKASSGYTVSMLLTLSVWMERYARL